MSVSMFFNPTSGVVSILVPTGGVKPDPKIFINIPPNCIDVHITGHDKIGDLLNINQLLINNPKNMIDKVNYKMMSNKIMIKDLSLQSGKNPNHGLIVIDQPVDLDSPFGPQNGKVILLPHGVLNRIGAWSKPEQDLLSQSNLGKALLELSKKTKK